MIDNMEFTTATFTNGVERTLDFRALDDAKIKEESKCALFAAMVVNEVDDDNSGAIETEEFQTNCEHFLKMGIEYLTKCDKAEKIPLSIDKDQDGIEMSELALEICRD